MRTNPFLDALLFLIGAIANRQAEIMMRIASEFGFARASRSRISTPSRTEPALFDLMQPHPEDVKHKITPKF